MDLGSHETIWTEEYGLSRTIRNPSGLEDMVLEAKTGQEHPLLQQVDLEVMDLEAKDHSGPGGIFPSGPSGPGGLSIRRLRSRWTREAKDHLDPEDPGDMVLEAKDSWDLEDRVPGQGPGGPGASAAAAAAAQSEDDRSRA
ncbi:hypothetical protein AVEN_17405-1 [Araneus ventricosus]|uniref:Uncharacterized protein n=1 Tax=Araneus ventricosus TaxID=182803 RepID=A0A4Y2H2G8_ARAVE|nr:hypothetical protein AVEN_17405-1 [Araneus ventricosus]